jgi:hypothetical protein
MTAIMDFVAKGIHKIGGVLLRSGSLAGQASWNQQTLEELKVFRISVFECWRK